MQLFLRGLMVVGVFVALAPSVYAQSDVPNGEPGISSYQAADDFCNAFFPVRSDCVISPDPDGGYYITYSLDDYDPKVVQSALNAFLIDNADPADFEAGLGPSIGELELNMQYVWNLYGTFMSDPMTDYIEAAGGRLYVPVVMEFDYERNGFSGSAPDFAVTSVIPVDSDGNGTINISNISFNQLGDWRYRFTVDPNGLYEPLSASTRGDNRTGWSNFQVVTSDAVPVPPDDSTWKLISDFDSYGVGYADQASGGTTCTALRGWTCDVRPGMPLPQIDMFVDGVLYDTFYPSITRNDTVNPWWANLPEYGNMPGCPARPGNPYGFNYMTPPELKDGVARTVELRATRSDGHSNNIVTAGWTPVIQEFEVQCAPETNVIDLGAQLSPVANQNPGQPFTLPGAVVRNFGDTPTGQPVTVRAEFDHGGDGFRPDDTVDFAVTQTISNLSAGASIAPAFGSITQEELGAWRVRLVVDPDEIVEPATSGYRANNVTPWRSYSVIEGENVITDINVTALSRQNTLPPANPDGSRNVRFNAEVLGVLDVTAGYSFTMSSPDNTYTQTGTVTGMPAIFTPPLQISNAAIGLYDVTLEVDLPAPGVVSPEAEEVRNNSRSLTDMALPPEPPTMTLVPDQDLVRAEDSTDIDLSVESPYALSCTVMGNGIDVAFTTSGTMYTDTVTTPSLTSTAVYELTCTEPTTATTWDPVESRVEVVAESEEI